MEGGIVARDYSLVGPSAREAEEHGLVNGTWYRSPVPRARLKELLRRSDGRAIRDTLIWIAAFVVSGSAGFALWGSWWAVPAFLAYGVLWGSSTDARWHECGHGTAFKTKWMNNAVYQIASFMILREPTIWRRSHARHHADTIIVGRDPEIASPRPPDLVAIGLSFLGIKQAQTYFTKLAIHACGRIRPEEATFIHESEFAGVFRMARLHIAIYIGVLALAAATRSILPLMYVGLPSLYGAWLYVLTGLTQHVGLAEDVLDHRLNSRTVYMNPIVRFLYLNMNYHVEHHMFPSVPYYALPALHDEVKTDTPVPYSGFVSAYREIIPTLLRQVKDPTYFAVRQLPPTARQGMPSSAVNVVAAE